MEKEYICATYKFVLIVHSKVDINWYENILKAVPVTFPNCIYILVNILNKQDI